MNDNQTDNFELSYQDNSIEIIGNNWENVGDQSTIEILEDFNINDIQQQQKTENINQKH